MKHPLKDTLLRFILALLVLVLAGALPLNRGLRAQNAIGFGSIGFSGMPDSINTGNTVPVGAFLQNFSAFNAYSDSVQIRGYIDTGSVVPVYIAFPVTYYQLGAGDSTFVIMPVSFSDPNLGGYFRIGSNTIVIWPISFDPNFVTGDSLHATVVVLPTGLGPELDNSPLVKCYPVPATGPLYITSLNAALRPVNVVVRDMSGRFVAESKSLDDGINTEPWPAGIYFLQVTFDDGSTGIYKISRQ